MAPCYFVVPGPECPGCSPAPGPDSGHCSGPGVASLGCVGAGEGGARPLSSDTTIRAWRQSGRVAVTVQCLIVMSENE